MSIKQTPYRRMPIHPLSGLPPGGARLPIYVRLKELAVEPLLDIVVCGNAGHW
jgi:hypothetical protein